MSFNAYLFVGWLVVGGRGLVDLIGDSRVLSYYTIYELIHVLLSSRMCFMKLDEPVLSVFMFRIISTWQIVP